MAGGGHPGHGRDAPAGLPGARLLSARQATPQQAPAVTAAGRGGRVLQRKCACDSRPGQESCACQGGKRLQRKLRVGAAGDPLEQEADRVADHVLRFPSGPPVAASRVAPSSSGAAAHEEAPAEVESALRSSGRPLDEDTRSDFETRFGHDFSRVRIHGDARATAAVQAQAFTVGSDIVFDEGRYAPGTAAGRRLLAHELTHVVQQSSSAPRIVSRFPDPSPKTPYKAVVLTLEEIAKDPGREAARKQSGQLSARACRRIGAGAKLDEANCPAILDDHAVVTVTAEKVGGLWLQIESSGVPNAGPREALHVLGAFLKPRPAAAPPAMKPTPPPRPPAPSAAEQGRRRSALEEARDAAQGVRSPAEYAQLRCMVPLGACPHSRPGGLPDEAELKRYNDECRKTTGYTGPDVQPEGGDCADFGPLGSEEMVTPARLAQAQKLLEQYAKLVRAGVLTAGEIANVDAAIEIAEKAMEGLRPPSGAGPGPDEAPWAVAGKDGGPAPKPSILAAGVIAPVAGRLLFSGAARAAAHPGVLAGLLIVGGLVVMGYLYSNHQLRKAASRSLEALLLELVILFQKLTAKEIERRVKDETEPKVDPNKGPKKDPRPPRPWPPGPNEKKEPCTFQEVGSGGDPLADLFCEEVTGSSKAKDILVTTPEGDKAWYDALQGSLATECKCGYVSVIEAFDRARRTGGKVPFWAEARMSELDQQKGRGFRVARRCGLTLRYYVSSKRVADFLNDRWGVGEQFVFWTPSDLCD